MGEAGLEYVQEVYAACATVGYDGDGGRRLKKMIERVETGVGDVADLVALTQQVQLASIKWARRSR